VQLSLAGPHLAPDQRGRGPRPVWRCYAPDVAWRPAERLRRARRPRE